MEYVSTIHRLRIVPALTRCIAAVAAVCTIACGAPETPREEGAEPSLMESATDEAAAGETPALVWMSPQDGATVTSPVHVMFAIQNFQISAVPEGTLEATRPGTGHYHVGVDTECLPAGAEIPQASPWVHLGDGSSMMNMRLPPGEHTLTLQIGDDLHRTLEGLCSTITVNVNE